MEKNGELFYNNYKKRSVIELKPAVSSLWRVWDRTPAVILISYTDVLRQYAHVSVVELPFRYSFRSFFSWNEFFWNEFL